MRNNWIPYIRELGLRKDAALPLLIPVIAGAKALLAAGAAKAAVAGGALVAKAAGGLAAAKAAGAAFAATKTGAALITAGKVANTALTASTIYDVAKSATGNDATSGAQTTAQESANNQTESLNTSAAPSNTSTPPGNY